MRADYLHALSDCPITATTFFGAMAASTRPPSNLCKSGIKVIWECGSAEEARNAKADGVDVIIAQGFEAVGHVHGLVTWC